MQEFFYKYSGFLLAGAIGASINKLRKRMSWSRFFRSCLIATFTSLCAGVLFLHLMNLPIPVVNALCGIVGVFSESILDEVEDMIRKASDYIERKLNQ
ncbi:phage holin family protein [Capnocytophaga sp. oral taxon 878]|uniref:phage holin family protein n=1 Tax=Capnocytophaga sp. oral taxon 878 TaxID=1316596 RepID=UPI000D02AACB|nr:phage holin family protein [Capnocytophaga sp. oral taxon 878]AVM49308.1 hypothetical protein C4H12_01815 [Capnocytophaga sp. oral taxon 878]